MLDSRLATRLLFGTAALAGLAFVGVSAAVARGKTSRLDKRARLHLQPGNEPLRRAARGTTPIGKWWGQLPAALATARRLRHHGRTSGAVAVVGSSLGAALLSEGLDRAMKHRGPPAHSGNPSKQSYPSGHALQTSALALTSSYVLWRERLMPTWSAAPLAFLSLAAGVGRLLLDRHWTSDVVGGYCAGIAWGATCAGLYERTRWR